MDQNKSFDIKAMGLIGMDRSDLMLRALRGLNIAASRADFTLRSDVQPFHIEAARAGLGVAAIQDAIVQRLPDGPEKLQALDLGFSLPPMPVWLVAPIDVQRAARVRTVYDALATGLTEFYAPA